MSLNTALVDRARLHVYEATDSKANGATVMEWQPGPWFRCRLTIEGAPEAVDAAGGHIETTISPQLMVGVKALDRTPLTIRANDRVEVASPELGTALWDVQGDPTPIRKKRRLIGATASLRRVVSPYVIKAGMQ